VIDATYRTWPDRENTGVLGSSFGGIASLVLALDHSDVFGRVGAMSTSFSWGNTGNRVSSGEVPFSTRLYIDAGDTNDGGDGTIAVRDALLAGGRTLDGDLYFQIGYGQQHNEVAWNARLPECLKALFPITDESNDLERPLTRAGDIDGDGFVGNADLQAIIDGWGSTAGEWGYNPMADLDGDGVVSNGDLQDVLDYWAAGCP
jgi:pimeloyl-ACP methyl ester carboxylesterase